jgi:hypothetical protein
MSTWLEGEVPTVGEIEEVLLNSPRNKWNDKTQSFDTQAKAIHELFKRKLTGKV